DQNVARLDVDAFARVTQGTVETYTDLDLPVTGRLSQDREQARRGVAESSGANAASGDTLGETTICKRATNQGHCLDHIEVSGLWQRKHPWWEKTACVEHITASSPDVDDVPVLKDDIGRAERRFLPRFDSQRDSDCLISTFALTT